MLSLAVLVSLTLLSSSYLLLSLYERAYALENLDGKNEEVTRMNENFNARVLHVHSLVQKVPSLESVVDIQIADVLLGYANSSIDIQAIEILPTGEITNITLRGSALTREALLQFQSTIQNNPSFKDLSIPVETLTKQKDISFNVNFTYHEK